MKLPIPFLQQKKHNTDYYLALILTDDKACAVVLHENEGLLKRLNSHEEHFPLSIEDISREDFIAVIDRTISRAEEILPPDIETHQTIFGVKASWVTAETKKIKKEYLEKLKKVCDSLDLTPIGFMVTTEAIIHLLQSDEGAPLSAMFAEIEKTTINLSLFRGGQLIQSVTSPRGDSAPETVDKLVSHFTVPVLPARIIIYQTKHDERTQQSFLNHQWSKTLPFLHMPQVLVLPLNYASRAVAFGAATQMGFAIEPPTEALTQQPLANEYDEVLPSDEENLTEEMIHETPIVPVKKDEDEELPDMTTTRAQQPQGGDFGFVIDGDALPSTPAHTPSIESDSLTTPTMHQPRANMPIHEPHYEDAQEDDTEAATSLSTITKKLPFLDKLKRFSLPKRIHLPRIPGFGKGNPLIKILLPIIVLGALGTGLWMYYTNTVQATVQITVSPKPVSQDETITFSTAAASDFTNNVIAAKTITASVDGDATTDATGKKDVGEKAKGSVTLYNNSTDPVTLSTNTTLKAASGQTFTLDSSAQIPASTGDVFTGTKPGTVQASVTANDIGPDSNIAEGTRFSIGNNSDLAAKNDAAFSGGTKKAITIVSKDDLAKLRTELIKKFKGNGQSALSQKSISGETILPIVGDATLQNEKFDKKEGEEAKKVTLRGSVTFSGMSYQNDDLKNYAQTMLKAKSDQDTTIAPNSINASVKDVTRKNSKAANASVTIQAGILPQIDTNDVIDTIKDKSYTKAKEAIANLPQVSKADIIFNPPLPLLPSLLPTLPKHITVEIKTQQ